eukprot:CAMPEP_0177662648 /NCGR_PEP_ID=MMETSP0447-20121125/19427_1 /TAXON_ID=0 /ORGANISM="Stygamoeba regulata, Strain BSH-02190019" /LENGTH=215 /DNA_ID=CAMNT_0019168277 /DNA_START=306 /DNA_END=956 /DNA_ORIENTATION=+
MRRPRDATTACEDWWRRITDAVGAQHAPNRYPHALRVHTRKQVKHRPVAKTVVQVGQYQHGVWVQQRQRCIQDAVHVLEFGKLAPSSHAHQAGVMSAHRCHVIFPRSALVAPVHHNCTGAVLCQLVRPCYLWAAIDTSYEPVALQGGTLYPAENTTNRASLKALLARLCITSCMKSLGVQIGLILQWVARSSTEQPAQPRLLSPPVSVQARTSHP